MSILVKGMKMPQSCEECQFFAWKRRVGRYCAVDDRITFHATLDGFDVGYERDGDCPFIPVPPHGRLIDADELKTAFPCGESVRTECVRATIDHAPTVMPAEDGE